jgi:Arc/MetJ-type ribon-helix-helix transcriptional regulator
MGPPEETRAKGDEAPRRSVIDQFVERTLRAVEDARVEGRELGRQLRPRFREAAKDVRRLLDRGFQDLGAFKEDVEGKLRQTVIMTRLTREDAEALDLLVEAGLFDSRSQAVAYFVHAGLQSRAELLERVRRTVDRISELREELQRGLA